MLSAVQLEGLAGKTAGFIIVAKSVTRASSFEAYAYNSTELEVTVASYFATSGSKSKDELHIFYVLVAPPTNPSTISIHRILIGLSFMRVRSDHEEWRQ